MTTEVIVHTEIMLHAEQRQNDQATRYRSQPSAVIERSWQRRAVYSLPSEHTRYTIYGKLWGRNNRAPDKHALVSNDAMT